AELDPERDLGRNPLFQVMFQYQENVKPLFETEDLKLSSVETSTHTAKFDLSMAVIARDETLKCLMEYRTELFREETIAQLLDHYKTLLESIVADPIERIATLRLMSDAERSELIDSGRGERAEFPREQTIHKLFEEQVERTPNEPALIFRNGQMSYHVLNARANQLASYLRDRGVGLETRVAIRMERSPEMIVGLLGILKAGGAYVPLDPAYPEERALYILEDSGASLLLTKEGLIESPLTARVPVVSLDDESEHISVVNASNPQIKHTAENAAHVIYTSGSTGRPKGVISAH